jgi:peptide/nickel transport system permease protein
VRGTASNLARLLRAQPLRLVGFVIVAVVVVAAIFAPLIAPKNPEAADPAHVLVRPSHQALFGTDSSGMDIFSRVVYGARIDLTIAVGVTLIAIALGVPLGVLSGYLRGRVGEVISRSFDVVQSFPVFVVAMAVAAAHGGGSALLVVLILGVLFSAIFVRLMRSQTYALRDRGFVDAARLSGASTWRIVRFHLIPNSIAPAIAQMSVLAGFTILLTAGLSFIGAGVPAPQPEWGSMVSVGAGDLGTGVWWTTLIPSAAIGVAVLGFAYVGDTLEVCFNPQARQRVGIREAMLFAPQAAAQIAVEPAEEP